MSLGAGPGAVPAAAPQVRALVFEPLDGLSTLVVDGEAVPLGNAVALEVHPGLLTMVVSPLLKQQ